MNVFKKKREKKTVENVTKVTFPTLFKRVYHWSEREARSPFHWLSTSVSLRWENLHCVFNNYLYLTTWLAAAVTFHTSWWPSPDSHPPFFLCSPLTLFWFTDGEGAAAPSSGSTPSGGPQGGQHSSTFFLFISSEDAESLSQYYPRLLFVSSTRKEIECAPVRGPPSPLPLYTTSFKNLLLFVFLCFPKLREQGLVRLKSHVVLHAELTGYLLSTKPRWCVICLLEYAMNVSPTLCQ